MMRELFDTVSFKSSRMLTQAYSTSFSLGILHLDRHLRSPIYAIYGFVRIADEIVDCFHFHDKALLLQQFKQQTKEAIEEGISTNPILNSFQITVRQFNIDQELIEAFFQSMEMDLNKVDYNQALFDAYIYGSAEVVGLMCLRVFCEGSDSQYTQLRPYAQQLGAAFQKVNFLRDLKSDNQHLGRIYFPGLDIQNFSETVKQQLEQDIQFSFDEALKGIRMLPSSSRRGVHLAYLYYNLLFKKIKRTSALEVLMKRIRIDNFSKLLIMVRSYVFPLSA